MRYQLLSATLFACLTFSGCGGGEADAPSLALVTGTVTFKGKPISGADVTFSVKGKPLAIGQTDADGKFTLTTGRRFGAPIGKAKVGISKRGENPDFKADMKPEDMAKMAKMNKGAPVKMPKPVIPLKYGDPEVSKLEADIGADGSKNVFKYDLVD